MIGAKREDLYLSHMIWNDLKNNADEDYLFDRNLRSKYNANTQAALEKVLIPGTIKKILLFSNIIPKILNY